MAFLFSPLTLRGLTLRNRVVMSPMCMYSAGTDGRATPWHLAHYGARAVGGVGLIMTEATAVEARGRISQGDLGLWDDAQMEALQPIVRVCQAAGAAFGVQLNHAGRKAWSSTKGQGPDVPVAPSALPQAPDWVSPAALTPAEIDALVDAWAAAARRAEAIGIDALEIHAAHGYLLHQFLTPLANQRTDEYGGTPANRRRLLLRVVDAVRAVWPESKPMAVRFSCSDWLPGGLTVEDVAEVGNALKGHGVDVLDCSSGGLEGGLPPSIGPGYQVPLADHLRRTVGLPVIAVGLITAPEQAEHILRTGQADLVAFGRELLRSPYWPLSAARVLGVDWPWPAAYRRAKPL